MQLLAGIANAFYQAMLDVHMHIFELDSPIEGAGGYLCQNIVQTTGDAGAFISANDQFFPIRAGEGAFMSP